jgi:hypothetical protein
MIGFLKTGAVVRLLGVPGNSVNGRCICFARSCRVVIPCVVVRCLCLCVVSQVSTVSMSTVAFFGTFSCAVVVVVVMQSESKSCAGVCFLVSASFACVQSCRVFCRYREYRLTCVETLLKFCTIVCV